ncbi:MAG: NAD(P)-binding domain-containing protein [Dermatophilaceae bacterium]
MVHESSPGDPDVIVIGAGPGGLAVAGCLQQNGVRALVVDRAPHVGHTWRGHYDRLRLHTPRELSGLPGLPIPRRFGRWVARDDVVRYLEMYAAHHRLDLRLGVGVDRLDREGSRWRVHLADGTVLSAAHVVVATGYNNTPVDNILRRSTLGWPAQGTGILIRHLPPALVDRVAAVLEKVETPDPPAQGLARPDTGLYAQALRGRIPIQDVGIVDAIRSGQVEVVAAVAGVEG